MKTTVLYGPQGCGKSRKTKELMAFFGCNEVIDEWNYTKKLKRGALHMTSDPDVLVKLKSSKTKLVHFDQIKNKV